MIHRKVRIVCVWSHVASMRMKLECDVRGVNVLCLV